MMMAIGCICIVLWTVSGIFHWWLVIRNQDRLELIDIFMFPIAAMIGPVGLVSYVIINHEGSVPNPFRRRK
jgi:hypothetical protein